KSQAGRQNNEQIHGKNDSAGSSRRSSISARSGFDEEHRSIIRHIRGGRDAEHQRKISAVESKGAVEQHSRGHGLKSRRIGGIHGIASFGSDRSLIST